MDTPCHDDLPDPAPDWWRGAVFYQIYPRSFLDTSGNGIGDLGGVLAKLDYLADLGVDGLWLSPFFPSPMADFGYDVADYCNVDPLFGTLALFDTLLAEAHARGLKVIIDQVYSHTSDLHDWFVQSRQSRDNSKADWYVWADAGTDGTPPNNWLSVFGGPAWTWEVARGQYYLHNFLSRQPDLNLHNEAVQEALLAVARFWLDRGVDGFRLDVANYFCHDPRLRDNPARQAPAGARPYDLQDHLYNRSRPEALTFLRRLRRVLDDYPGAMSVAEIFSARPVQRSIEYTNSSTLLHTAYSFHYLDSAALTPDNLRSPFAQWQDGAAWPSWSFSNHDVPRVLSRWGASTPSAAPSAELARLLNGVLCCLRGTIFLYQGEELGLPQAEVPFEDLQDPEAIRSWPHTLGRDGARTPMPWQAAAPHGGFSAAHAPINPWLPMAASHLPLSVDRQEADPHSTLNFTRQLLAWRARHPALRLGSISFEDAPAPILAFQRQTENQRILCVFNISPAPADYLFTDETDIDNAFFINMSPPKGQDKKTGQALLRLPGWSGVIIP